MRNRKKKRKTKAANVKTIFKQSIVLFYTHTALILFHFNME